MQNGNFKAAIIVSMWIAYLAFLIISADTVESGWLFALAMVSALPLLVGMSVVWRMYREDQRTVTYEEQEKRKRDRLDEVLRDLSDEELIRLRQRLSDGSVDDDMLYEQIIGTDGEFVRHS